MREVGNLWGLGVVWVSKPGCLAQPAQVLPANQRFLHHPACAKLKNDIISGSKSAFQGKAVQKPSRLSGHYPALDAVKTEGGHLREPVGQFTAREGGSRRLLPGCPGGNGEARTGCDFGRSAERSGWRERDHTRRGRRGGDRRHQQPRRAGLEKGRG